MTDKKPTPNNKKTIKPTKDSDFLNRQSDLENCNDATASGVAKRENQKEIGGFENRKEPTRYGDWEVGGRCSDF